MPNGVVGVISSLRKRANDVPPPVEKEEEPALLADDDLTEKNLPSRA
jgi:hypothetical protein